MSGGLATLFVPGVGVVPCKLYVHSTPIRLGQGGVSVAWGCWHVRWKALNY